MADIRTETQIVAQLESLRADAAERLLDRDTSVPHELDAALAAVGSITGAARVAWFEFEFELDSDGRYVEEKQEWRDHGIAEGIGARYHDDELRSLFDVLFAGRPVWLDAGSTDSDHPGLTAVVAEEDLTGIIAAPGRARGRTTHAISVDHRAADPVLSDAVADAVTRLAGLFATAFHQQELRRGFEQHLNRRQRLESLGLLAGGLAHDFNNVLLVVQLTSEMLLDELPDDLDGAKERLGQILTAATSGAEMTRRLLVFSKQELQPQSVSELGTQVDQTVQLASRLLPDSIVLDVRVDEDARRARVAGGGLDQAILNLLGNAADSMPEGGTVELTGRLDGAVACLEVRDSGTGMDRETLERACDPFFTTKEPGSGTGLGLAMVHGLVTKMGGELSVESEPGRGTRVALRLPVTDRPLEELPTSTDAIGGSESILVVEDDAVVRRVSKAVLEDAGYSVLLAADGDEAVEVLKRGPAPQLIVSDVVMPGRGGAGLHDDLERLGLDVPLLFCTGYSSGSLSDGMLDGDRRLLLTKPYSKADLLRAVRRLLDR